MGSADEVSRRLKKGDFFGELALLSTDKRAATVSSVEKTTVLTLGRVQFTRLLGPLKDREKLKMNSTCVTKQAQKSACPAQHCEAWGTTTFCLLGVC